MNARRILTVVGARPQFVKAAPVTHALAAIGLAETILHTGQHYDRDMSDVFFDELGIPAPEIALGVGQAPRPVQLARMIEGISAAIDATRPAMVVVYGDTTSTLAGALAAAVASTPLAHIEAGLRSFNRTMPEELHRRLADHVADVFFCPTSTAVGHLRNEGIVDRVHLVGDTMYDATLAATSRGSSVVGRLGLAPGGYALATLHRPYNVDDPTNLAALADALAGVGMPVVFPVHPRTRARLADLPGRPLEGGAVRAIDPVGYLDMIALVAGARVVLTDSGGVQKEAFFLSVPCVTVRPETEWIETLEDGWNVLAPRPDMIAAAANRPRPVKEPRKAFGDGDAARRIAGILAEEVSGRSPASACNR